jgi:hypothetical protein
MDHFPFLGSDLSGIRIGIRPGVMWTVSRRFPHPVIPTITIAIAERFQKGSMVLMAPGDETWKTNATVILKGAIFAVCSEMVC